ncbi:tRNA dihydrouridine synthase [Fluviispira multicolorata]|uniref:tRNA-dihydrouridine synthase n=1 Tax=Fluviispira multicolorata TaxID=2654512 RepID=A0A833JEW4_9BACT|nr:tRNA-dihydrouridine synthase [Fluviispira multicolorata]KAB8033409.1 tRNA dihydrouridine synthase DusB [Fluviispira multicolorata]
MSFFNQPIQIGNLTLKNRVFLAPLAGVSDIPFRRICQELGAGLTYVEMLSATAIAYNNKRTFEMMARHASENVLGVQITGPTAAQVAHAISVLDKQGFETIDINMGCPVRKVVTAGCGSGILKDPERISETVKLARSATSRPLSAKFRLGYTRENINVVNTVERVLAENVDMFTIHGRTRSESYSTPCDLSGIKLAMHTALANSKPVIKVGNGDVFDLSSALKMQQETACDAIMVSRGALGNPWIFKEILSAKKVQPEFSEWLDVVFRHLDYQEEHFGKTKLAAILARKHLLWYSKGFPASKSLRDVLNRVEDLNDARALLKNYAANTPKDFIRYAGSNTDLSSDYDPKYEMDRKLDRGVGDEGMEQSV